MYTTVFTEHPYKALEEVMSLTFFLFSPGSSGLSHFSADRFVSVFLLDGQRDGGNLWEFLSPAGSVLLDEHLGDPGRRRHKAQRHRALAWKVFCSYVGLALEKLRVHREAAEWSSTTIDFIIYTCSFFCCDMSKWPIKHDSPN